MQQLKDSTEAVSILDELIPLKGASHTDVVEYVVDVPFRNAECHALLADGRKVGLVEPWKFKGWSGRDASRTLLFRVNGAHLKIDIEDELAGKAPGRIHNIVLETFALRCASTLRKFIGIDGGQVLLPA